MITKKEKNTVAIQMILSVIAVAFITSNVDQKPLKNILLICVFIFMGGVFGYNLMKRKANGDPVNYKYVLLVTLILAVIALVINKIKDEVFK